MADAVKPVVGNRGQMPAPQPAVAELVPPHHTDADGPKVDTAEPEQHVINKVGDSGSSVTVTAPTSHSIDVVATRDGFIYNMRKVVGDRFKVSDMSQVGEWMKLADPKAEDKRQAELKQLRLKARS